MLIFCFKFLLHLARHNYTHNCFCGFSSWSLGCHNLCTIISIVLYHISLLEKLTRYVEIISFESTFETFAIFVKVDNFNTVCIYTGDSPLFLSVNNSIILGCMYCSCIILRMSVLLTLSKKFFRSMKYIHFSFLKVFAFRH